MPISRIHVNRHAIAKNRKYGTNEPVVSVKQSGKNLRGYGAKVVVDGRVVCEVVYRPNKPLSCGAVLWIETTEEVIVK
jgi:hypothetical protein